MKKIIFSLICFLMLLMIAPRLHAQQKIFNEITDLGINVPITSITQDRQGYMWFGTRDPSAGLYRYSASGVVSFFHNPNDSNSLSNNQISALSTDSSGMIWIGTGAGLDRFDPATHTFTHYRHNPIDPGSLSSDTVYALLTDHTGNLWVGCRSGGLSLLNRTTGKFTHYTYQPNDPSSLSSNRALALYEDHEGTLWAGCLPFPKQHQPGGLVSLDKSTGKFTRFQHDSTNPKSLSNNFVTSILEDSRGNFWVGGAGNSLQTLNRATGEFTHYTYDPAHPERLSAPPILKGGRLNFIDFIKEDASGAIWINTQLQGISKYDPKTKKVTHYGGLFLGNRFFQDTVSGFNNSSATAIFISKDGLLWISARVGGNHLYTVNPFPKNFPFYPTKQPFVNAFYRDKQQALWMATDGGLLYKPAQGAEKLYAHDPHNLNSPAIAGISAMIADKKGNLWLGTYDAVNETQSVLDRFDPTTGVFTHIISSGQLEGNRIQGFCFDDDEQLLWMGTQGGLYKINANTGAIIQHYTRDKKDTNSLSNNKVNCVFADGDRLWVATLGLNALNKKTVQWKHYLNNTVFLALFKDADGTLWAGAADGLYRYDQKKDNFQLYRDAFTGLEIKSAANILEDSQHNLWVSSTNIIYRISADRDSLRVYGRQNKIVLNVTAGQIAYQSEDGMIYMGNQTGYYAFNPQDLSSVPQISPTLYITGFLLGDSIVKPGPNSPLKVPVFQTKDIHLNHNQNSFSFTFEALHYATPGAVRYRYMLEGYDQHWRDGGSEGKAYYFNVRHGHYIFKVMAINSDGSWSQTEMAVIVSPPWWITWWAISLFILMLMGIIWSVAYYRSRRLRRENKKLEEKVNHRTEQLRKSLEDLKSTQEQLIQSEKMASLGELTAGIAHEIQNPLNFVNNFSDINQELIGELVEEADKGNTDEVKEIASDIKSNSEKINHHGKRADAIVKGMLQHSRSSSGVKEPTDINALCDEYLRLAYHGLRAKDKSFNATMETRFDENIGKINVVPQDIGRVLLNIINNAFFAVNERKKNLQGFQNLEGLQQGYVPTVTLVTHKDEKSVTISVRDNGNGIPEKIKDKIFQPFFTTKPTGEGTGLGLSLAYDIVKAHGGELKVETKESEGTEFSITLPDKIN